ncbi:ATP12 family chaperone protein [Altererythrobacter sp. Z27]|uniref:ATP12 family chaperone protein n=1 Tax=Altererythrobacter sp. Z27 TaxID=3461147 RepID=UPI004043D5FE
MKRFYKEVSVAEVPGGWQVTLDGRGIKSMRGAPQVLPSRALAEALASEWAGQGEDIDPAAFRFRDQADFAIDIVATDPAAAIDTLLGFAETDTLCYRADPDEPLYARQQAEWEPLVSALEQREGIAFTRVSGIMHRPQPPATLSRLRERLEELDHFALAGLQAAASLAASLAIALLALEQAEDPDVLWRAAGLEEEWQAEQWGRDPQAEEHRARKHADFLAACEWMRLQRA